MKDSCANQPQKKKEEEKEERDPCTHPHMFTQKLIQEPAQGI